MSTTVVSDKHLIEDKYKDLAFLNNYERAATARKGLDVMVFYSFADTIKMPEEALASIVNLLPRIVDGLKQKSMNLDPSSSEHLLKLITLFKKGEEIFGSIDEFNYWLKKPFWNSEQKPIDWLVTSGGVDLLIEEIDKLAQGYPV